MTTSLPSPPGTTCSAAAWAFQGRYGEASSYTSICLAEDDRLRAPRPQETLAGPGTTWPG